MLPRIGRSPKNAASCRAGLSEAWIEFFELYLLRSGTLETSCNGQSLTRKMTSHIINLEHSQTNWKLAHFFTVKTNTCTNVHRAQISAYCGLNLICAASVLFTDPR